MPLTLYRDEMVCSVGRVILDVDRVCVDSANCLCASNLWAKGRRVKYSFRCGAVLTDPTRHSTWRTRNRHAQRNARTLHTLASHGAVVRSVRLRPEKRPACLLGPLPHWTHTRRPPRRAAPPRRATRRAAPRRRATCCVRSSRVAHDAEDLVGEGLVVEAEVEAVHA